jgi:hypothetical protein
LSNPVRSRIAIEMQRHTDFGLQGCLSLFNAQPRTWRRSPERGVATGHPSARAITDPSGHTSQAAKSRHRRPSRRQGWGCAAADDHVCSSGGRPPPPTTTWSAVAEDSCLLGCKWPQSRAADVGCCGGVALPPQTPTK